MRLPFSFGKKEIKNYYVALLLQDEKVGAVVFEETGGKIHVAGRSEEHFTTSLEEAPFEEWLEVIDKIVSTAEEDLPENTQTQKTVFGVKQEWIEDGKIKKDYLVKLKKVCDELSLQPIGFLVFTEAIIHLLQKEEGAPVSAILVEIGKKIITISIIRAGRIIEVKQIPFATPIPKAVDEALKTFTNIEILPARIILFDSKNNDTATQAFTHHSWSKNLPFLHMPQTTVLPHAFDTKSVLFGTATQMGFEVAQKDIHVPLKTHVAVARKNVEEPEEEKSEETELNASLDTTEEKNDISDKKQEEKEDEKNTEEHEKTEDVEETDTPLEDTVSADYFGFVKNKDVTSIPHALGHQKHAEKTKDIPSDVVAQAFEEIPEEVKEEETKEMTAEGGLGRQSALLFSGIKNFVKQISFKKIFTKRRQVSPHIKTDHEQMKIPQNQIKPAQEKDVSTQKSFRRVFLIVPLVLLLCIGCVALYIFAVSATITLTVKPKVIQDEESITFAKNTTSDFSNNTVGMQTASADEKGTVTTDTTGKKAVGTPAKGKVTIFSRLSDTTTVSKGTAMTASNGLVFTLDNDVTIASFSGDPTDPSITVSNISITAKAIGPDSNLPSGTKFSVNGLSNSDVSAKNDNPFSGGTKKDVTVVDQKDVNKLMDDITKNLADNAKNDMSKNLSGTQQLLPFFIKQDISNKKLSKNVGDEAKSVSLDATVTYQSGIFDKNDVTSLASNVMKNKIPQDSNLSQNGIHTDITDLKQNNDTISGTLKLQAAFVPKIDTTGLAKQVAGKSFNQVANDLKNIPQVDSVTIVLKPNFSFLPKLLPKFSKNIQVLVKNE